MSDATAAAQTLRLQDEAMAAARVATLHNQQQQAAAEAQLREQQRRHQAKAAAQAEAQVSTLAPLGEAKSRVAPPPLLPAPPGAQYTSSCFVQLMWAFVDR